MKKKAGGKAVLRINHVHDFKLRSIHEYREIQKSLREKINLSDRFKIEEVNTVAGVDCAYFTHNDKSYATCSIVILDYKTKAILERYETFSKVEIPYMPGYLAFRELPLIIETAEKLLITPDVFMFDGNGYYHDMHMGLATHASFFLDKPTIGVAKSYYNEFRKRYILPENRKGAYTSIYEDDKEVLRIIRTKKNTKPIFLSAGNYITLNSATEITMNFILNSKLPETTRIADVDSNRYKREVLNSFSDIENKKNGVNIYE